MKHLRLIILSLVFLLALSLAAIAQTQTPVDPVNWRELIVFLVDIDGWEAQDEPEGQTVSMANFKMSQASRDYSSGDKDLEIEIIDGGYVPMVYQGFLMAMNYEIDSSDEYVKKITIKDYPGIEKYTYDDEDAEVILLVEDRFLIRFKCDNVPDTEELKTIAESFDLDGIAALAK
ncbi:MAG: hypothetical protein GQ545_01530 [Candidatus Aminicenantes bacterium]|nr:hypothetical protein [Candidatus Aminicenantes bacterium]